jgi:hypothetical protein
MDRKAMYTNFPSLYDTTDSEHVPAELHSVWPASLPQELLIFSWAALLQSYSGIAEPVFLFEGKPIQVNLSLERWVEVEVEDLGRQDGHHTSINIQNVRYQKKSYCAKLILL